MASFTISPAPPMHSSLHLDRLKREKSAFRTRLLRWYRTHKRDLPWRKKKVPYRIWVSEIMLQQTRVNAVLDHYRRFLRDFPTVRSLANAPQSKVLAAWSGLGYYRRARMMHSAARTIVRDHRGRIPRTAEQLRTLSGVGRYTAAAIASIAFDEPVSVVDGNVERVMQRISGSPNLAMKETWDVMDHLISPTHPGDFNQAMMELGATVCLPKTPQCSKCPVLQWCATQGAHSSIKTASRQRISTHYALARENGRIRLHKRSAAESLMPGMWELPQVASSNGKPILRLRHSITSTDYDVCVHDAQNAPGRWVRTSDLASLPLTGLSRKILKRLGILVIHD